MFNEKDTWDLTHMFQDAAHWRSQLEEAKSLAKTLSAMQGTIAADGQQLCTALQLNDTLGETLTALFVYAKMYFDQNMSNSGQRSL